MGKPRRGGSSLTTIIGWVALALGIGLVIVHFVVIGIPHGEAPVLSEPERNLIQDPEEAEQQPPPQQQQSQQHLRGQQEQVNAESPLRLQQDAVVANARAAVGEAKGSKSDPVPDQAASGAASKDEDLRLAELKEWEMSDENNAKFPGPRPGDVQRRSMAPDIFPGQGPGHEHGLLGRSDDGLERIPPTPLPSAPMTTDDRREAHRGFCFNSRVSDSISLDRSQADKRSDACRKRYDEYPKDLPKASVVIVFHNENFSILVRSIHSVLNHAPPHLLHEIIVVDDASKPDPERFYQKHWDRLQDELTDYLMTLPKVTLVRLKERRGLMVARMEGIWRASAEVTVFLDSHIECSPGYLEPMLARIKDTDGKSVVVPSIDSIGSEDFAYRKGGGLGVLGFSWTLGQEPSGADTGRDGTRPSRSPVMAGGLLASDRKMFLKLGGYDPDMRLYGGEEMEIGFRTWMCGGAIEYIPCSHIGHVFRTPAYWQGQVYRVPGEEISRNKLRTALVWMDDYAKLVEYATAPLPETLPLGDLTPRQHIREKLQCKDFNWYIRHVVPNMYAPTLSAEAKGGCLENKLKGACIDTLGQTGEGALLGAYPCHFQHGTQAMVMDSDGLVRLPQTGYTECMVLAGTDSVKLRRCSKNDEEQLWSWDPDTKHFKSRRTNSCLTFMDAPSPKSPFSLSVEACHDVLEQQWHWGH